MDMFADRTGGGEQRGRRAGHRHRVPVEPPAPPGSPYFLPAIPLRPLGLLHLRLSAPARSAPWSWAALVLAHHPAATADDRARAAASGCEPVSAKKTRPPEKAASASPAAPRSPCLMPARKEKPAAKGRPDTRVDPMAPAYRTEDDKLHTLSPPRRRRK